MYNGYHHIAAAAAIIAASSSSIVVLEALLDVFREIPLELRVLSMTRKTTGEGEEGNPPPPVDVGTLEAIRCKVMILGENEGSFRHCRVELTSENDIFFHYTHSLAEMQFRDIQEEQKLMIEFNEYVNVFIKMCNSCIAEPHAFLGVLVMARDGTARLDFVQNMEYKFIELLSAEFIASPDTVIRQHITYRYNALKSKLNASQARLQDFHAIVKLKNPSLLLQIQKGTVRAGTPYLATSTEGEVSYVKTCPTPLQSSSSAATALAPGVSGEVTTDVTKGSGQHPVLKNSAIVVMAHDREQYLASCLESLLALDGIQLFTMYVSLDEVSAFNRMEGVIRDKERQHGRRIGVWHRPLIPPLTAYDTLPSSKIAAHYRYALEQVYTVHQHDYVIMVENDLIFAPDFLTLFINTAKLLQDDDSLYCISGWNDNGFIEYATNETTLFRTHFFPGLGWMAHRSLWDRIRWKWPNAPTTGWDHWMRLSNPTLNARPIDEVPRSRHIAVEGSNVHAADQAGIYQRMALSSGRGVVGGGGGGGGMMIREYDEALRKMISLAIPSTLDQLSNILIQGQQQAADNNAGGLVPMDRIYMIPYLREEYPIIQQRLNLFPNYFRGQHKGVVIINIHAARTTRLIFIDRRSGHQWLPNNISLTPPPLMTYLSASRGVSCNDACHNNNDMVCYDHLLEFGNDCHVMLTHFPCEQGCGHQLGLELPAYVLDGGLHTFGQCLVTDHGAPSCLTSHPSTARMCVCLPPPPPPSTTNNM
ncbi:hypothetical protein FOL46_000315, partial [Perkinsus olseni]